MIIDAFLGEHAVIYSWFNYLEQSISDSTNISILHAQPKLLVAALSDHALLEEELLFTTLEPLIGSNGPLAVMRKEHDEVDQFLKHLLTIKNGDRLQENLLQFIAFTRDHFAKEENILFPMASKALKPSILIDLGTQWAEHHGISLSLEDHEITG